MSFQNINRVQNTVINERSSSLNNVFIAALYDINNSIYNHSPQDGLGSLISFGGRVYNKRFNGYYAYLWDLWKLRQKVGYANNFDKYYYINYQSGFYPLFLDSLSFDAGSDLYSPIKNFNNITVQNLPVFSKQKFTIESINFSPLIAFGNNNQDYLGEYNIYRASKIPLFPLQLMTTVESFKMFGPLFLTRFEISVDGSSKLGEVSVKTSFSGGKSLLSNFNGNISAPSSYEFTPKKIKLINGEELDEISYDFNKYRRANLLDCKVLILDPGSINLWNRDSVRQYLDSNVNPYNAPYYKVISMSLSVTQEIEYQFTYPGIREGDNLYYEGDSSGPRYASLTSRTVSGKIKLLAYKDNIVFYNPQSIIMDFGGPFFYAMKYVEFSNPSIDISVGELYSYTFSFTARVSENYSFPNTSTSVYSEFL